MKAKTFSMVPALLLGLGLVACSGADATTDAVDMKGAAPMFPDFSYDSQMQPPGSPVQAEFKASVNGEMRVAARATSKAGKLAGVAQTGKLAIELHTKLEGSLHVAAGMVKYDGPIPGLDDVDVPITGDVPFDPFLLQDGEQASLDAAVPPTDLPPIPLDAIGVPGTLVLHVKEGSVVHGTLHGSCVSASGGKATFAGDTQTSGTIVLGATVKLDLPMPLGKEIDVPDMTIQLPTTPGTISAEAGAGGISDFRDGACAAGDGAASDAPATDAPASSDDGTAPQDAAGTCGGLEQKGATVRFSEVPDGSLLQVTGGKIADGTYTLLSVVGTPSTPLALRSAYAHVRETISFSGTTVTDVLENVGSGKAPVHYSGVFKASASAESLTLGYQCPANSEWTDYWYASDGTTLTLLDKSGTVAMTYGKL
jgi:hypothetical protein